MIRVFPPLLFLVLTVVAGPAAVAAANAEQIESLFASAEEQFRAPPEEWFTETRSKLQEEIQRVSYALAAGGDERAGAWKAYLHWDLLEKNLGSRETVELSEVELVRRWLYSNQEGLESAFFAELRARINAYSDAVFTLSHGDLLSTFHDKVALARRQCESLIESPSDTNAVALGETLGWFERTRQLTDEVGRARSLLSSPNATFVVSPSLVNRITKRLKIDVDETVSISNQVVMPRSGPLQPRTLNVSGTANTTGQVDMEIRPNREVAEVDVVFQGWVESQSQAETGPVTLYIDTHGEVQAIKPIYFGPDGLQFGVTEVIPQVTSSVTGVAARSRIVRRIGSRRANRPETQYQMNAEARSTTGRRLRQHFDQRVGVAIDEMRSEMGQFQSSMDSLADVVAPVLREGAVPRFHSACTSAQGIELNANAANRGQLGAPTAHPNQLERGDIQLRVHCSFFSNTAETMLGGKRLSDSWFMRYAEMLYSELPMPLMVHSRSKRWAIRAAKLRPVELRLTHPNRFTFVIHSSAVELDGREYAVDSTATANYELVRNEFDEYDEYALERDGTVQLESALPAHVHDFWHGKLNAFFGPVLNAGGVVLPDTGPIGILKKLELEELEIEGGWFTAAWSVPTAVIDELLSTRSRAAVADSAG